MGNEETGVDPGRRTGEHRVKSIAADADSAEGRNHGSPPDDAGPVVRRPGALDEQSGGLTVGAQFKRADFATQMRSRAGWTFWSAVKSLGISRTRTTVSAA